MLKKKKIKGKAYKRIAFGSGGALATLYLLWQKGNHPSQNTDHSCELLDTLETFATEDVDSEGAVVGMRFPKDGADVVVSIGLHEYMPSFFGTLNPPGAVSRDFKKLKQSVADAEKVFDKTLVDEDWTLEDGIWFSPEARNRPKSEDEDAPESDAAAESDPSEGGTGEDEEPVLSDDAGVDAEDVDEDAA